MTDADKTRRVLVALDRSPLGRAAIERAARVAATLHAELIGIYVEDEDLVRLSGLPFACEISTHGGIAHALDIDSMRKRLQAEAALARRELERGAGAVSVHTRFEIRHGSVTNEILAACSEVDYVVVGRSRRATPRGRPGATASALARRAGRPVWLVQSRRMRTEALLLVLDESADVERAVAACSGVSEPGARWVVAIAGRAAAASTAETQARVERALARERRSAELVVLERCDASTLGTVLSRLGDAVVAFALPSDAAMADRVAALAESLPCNALIIPAPESMERPRSARR